MEEIFSQKSFNYFIWTPLGSRINIQINFSITSTLRCKQSDIVPIIYPGVIDTAGNLPPVLFSPMVNQQPVLLTLVANLRPVSTTPVVPVAKSISGVVDTGGKFAPVSLITVVHIDLQIFPWFFEKS
jgi:hypothetical protein